MADDWISSTRLYGIHSGMKNRCNNPKSRGYRWYGGKGIHVCDEWSGPDGASRFIAWALSHGYEDGLTIDRIDHDGDYSPENCRWIPHEINSARMDRNNRGPYGEAFSFIDNHSGKISMIGFSGKTAEIMLKDGSIHRFAPA